MPVSMFVNPPYIFHIAHNSPQCVCCSLCADSEHRDLNLSSMPVISSPTLPYLIWSILASPSSKSPASPQAYNRMHRPIISSLTSVCLVWLIKTSPSTKSSARPHSHAHIPSPTLHAEVSPCPAKPSAPPIPAMIMPLPIWILASTQPLVTSIIPVRWQDTPPLTLIYAVMLQDLHQQHQQQQPPRSNTHVKHHCHNMQPG